MNFSQIMGREVLDTNVVKVGTVVDMDVSLPQGTVNHIVVKTGVFGKININIDKVEKFGDKIMLKVSKEELAQAPSHA
jgi:sporulation protein YlmC with PRC-barrel domain